MKTAVVLFNLGGPDARESIKPFLYNFFMDKNIIRAPLPVRWLVAKLISIRRSKNEAGDSYEALGGKSPLLENTKAQAQALQEKLGADYKVFTCMRYWHPMAEKVTRQVKEYGPDRIVLLPLYPQFSTTTTRSSFESWDQAAQDCGLDCPSVKICCYPADKNFVAASAENIKRVYSEALEATGNLDLPLPRILFSAHGLPEDIIKAGDPYQWQCEQSAAAIVAKMDVPMIDWTICYQSRVGPKKWIGPSTEEALQAAAADNVPVIIYPHAFVSEHVETLVEIEIEYREMAQKWGVPYFARVPTVGVSDIFIDGLAGMVTAFRDCQGIGPANLRCPSECSDCIADRESSLVKAA